MNQWPYQNKLHISFKVQVFFVIFEFTFMPLGFAKARESAKTLNQETTDDDAFQGFWRVKNMLSSLHIEATIQESEHLTDLNKISNGLIVLEKEAPMGTRCSLGKSIPPDQKSFYLMSLADKKDFAYKELERAMKTCKISDLVQTSSKHLQKIPEFEIHCDAQSMFNKDQTYKELINITSISLLNSKYALARSKTHYLCLEKLPPFVEKPVVLGKALKVRSQIPSPLERQESKTVSKLPPSLCDSPFFTEHHPDESVLGLWLGKTRLVYSDAVETALKSCKIHMGSNPLKIIRKMRHYEVLCGPDLIMPSAQSGFINWLSIVDDQRIISSAGGFFYCLEPRASISH